MSGRLSEALGMEGARLLGLSLATAGQLVVAPVHKSLARALGDDLAIKWMHEYGPFVVLGYWFVVYNLCMRCVS